MLVPPIACGGCRQPHFQSNRVTHREARVRESSHCRLTRRRLCCLTIRTNCAIAFTRELVVAQQSAAGASEGFLSSEAQVRDPQQMHNLSGQPHLRHTFDTREPSAGFVCGPAH